MAVRTTRFMTTLSTARDMSVTTTRAPLSWGLRDPRRGGRRGEEELHSIWHGGGLKLERVATLVTNPPHS